MKAWSQTKGTAADYYHAYRHALDEPQKAQQRMLADILARNRDCDFGRQYAFSSISSVESFQQRVPIHDYSSLQAGIDRMLAGADNVLCGESVILYEQTSGTSANGKFIPYTQAALEDFRSALFPWLYDLCENAPEIMEGGAYWSISPVGRQPGRTDGGTPIGVNNDALYFGETAASHIVQTLVVPHWVSQVSSMDAWQYITLRYLLCASDLRLISIWSPTFLLQLLEALPSHLDMLVEDIACGTVSCAGLEAFVQRMDLRKNSDRARLVKDSVTGQSIDTRQLWPELSLISCWASASSTAPAERLKAQFPHARLQAKGLLATEGVVSVPMAEAGQPALALLSGFYEFLSDTGEVYLCHQLVSDEIYSVLLTNNSGLYRYRIGDRVKVVAWLGATPCLEFVGRAGGVDLCGEKLSEEFVWPILSRIPGFTLLAPRLEPKPHYCLYVDAARVSQASILELSAQIEAALERNPQYRYARKLQQLGPVTIVRAAYPSQTYRDRFLQQAGSLGDIKPPCLSGDTAWHSYFKVVGN